jgi:hypothetical protein
MTEPPKKKVVEVYQTVNALDVNLATNVVNISTTGPQGPKGETGAAGANGTNGINGGNFTFEQQTPSASWSITHNLGYRPAVTVQDYGKIILEGDLNHINANNLAITFSEAVSGYAYLS